MVYTSEVDYIKEATLDSEKIARYDAIILKLEEIALSAAANEDVEEYSLDDGQTKIAKTYRGVESILKSIETLEIMRTRLQNRLKGYTSQLRHRHTV